MKLRKPQYKDPDITRPVPLPVDFSVVSPHERDVARYRAEDARTGEQSDETPRRVRRGLRHVRLKDRK